MWQSSLGPKVTVQHPPECEQLSGSQYITLVVRLLVDPAGSIKSGEIVDLDGGSCGRFSGTQGLVPAIERCLESMTDTDASE